MIAAELIVNDGPRHPAAWPATDTTNQALDRVATREAVVWRSEAERAMSDGDARLALRCWRVVRQFEPQAPDVLFRIGCCHALVGERDAARAAFQSLTRMHAAPRGLRQRAARLAQLLEPPQSH